MEPSTVVNRKRLKNVGFVSMKEHAKLVDPLVTAHEQNELYQTTWMRECNSDSDVEVKMPLTSPSVFPRRIVDQLPESIDIGFSEFQWMRTSVACCV